MTRHTLSYHPRSRFSSLTIRLNLFPGCNLVVLAKLIDYLARIDARGDLGNTLQWPPPFPGMSATLKQPIKKAVNDVVSPVIASRQTAKYGCSERVGCATSILFPYGSDYKPRSTPRSRDTPSRPQSSRLADGSPSSASTLLHRCTQ